MPTTHRLTAVLAGAALSATGIVALPAASAAPDPTYPTGTFHFERTSAFLYVDEYGERDSEANFFLRKDTLEDDTTAAEDVVVRVEDGRGGAGTRLWPNTSAPVMLTYDRVGTYQPRVWLTDADHHTTVVDLPPVTVLEDFTAPRIRLDLPAAGQRNRIAAWRVLRGPASDTGIGGTYVRYQVMQKRGSYWYFFNRPRYIDKEYPARWLKGARTLAATKTARYNYNGAHPGPGSGRWQSEPVVKLTKGPLVVCVSGEDSNDNRALNRCFTGKLTRR